MYGNLYHPETGRWLASVEDGKITSRDGRSYKLDGQKILSETGEVVGYVSPFIGKAQGSGAIATKLFGRG
jgi:hypothetical protein